MVKICDTTTYPDSNESIFSKHFESYPFPLSPFQKHSIEGIVQGSNILITAHTGCGKTLPAEFAIEYFVSQGKKVIYTAPIKALSNQKFYEFQKKFPHISFGILTGDIKTFSLQKHTDCEMSKNDLQLRENFTEKDIEYELKYLVRHH
jgi:superfamily II RNA helicase